MFRPVVAVEYPGAGRLEAMRLGLRLSDRSENPELGASSLLRGDGRPAVGPQRLGPIEIDLSAREGAGVAILEATLRNTEARPIHVDALVLGFRWTG
ncbi:MAG TPA: hypothetical protein VKE73_12825, partial [Myxococcota bacterium]|nr:hypothetical protein [Myxococcota bacterium]